MDAIDRKIIRNLQENARMPIKDISAKIGLSSPAVSIRIAKLEREGIISGYGMQLNREKLGYHVTAYISVEMVPVPPINNAFIGFSSFLIFSRGSFPAIIPCP